METRARGVRRIAEDPLVPLAGMVLAAMVLLGSVSGERTNERAGEAQAAPPEAVIAAVGKAYTPRLSLARSATVGTDDEAAAPACATAGVKVSYRLAAAARSEHVGT